MNILPCPFCGAVACKNLPLGFEQADFTISHTLHCPLFKYEMIVETRFYENNPIHIEDWNTRAPISQSDSDGYLQVAPTGHLAHRGDSLPLETPSSSPSTGDKLESAPPLGSQPLPQTAPE